MDFFLGGGGVNKVGILNFLSSNQKHKFHSFTMQTGTRVVFILFISYLNSCKSSWETYPASLTVWDIYKCLKQIKARGTRERGSIRNSLPHSVHVPSGLERAKQQLDSPKDSTFHGQIPERCRSTGIQRRSPWSRVFGQKECCRLCVEMLRSKKEKTTGQLGRAPWWQP